MGISLPFLVLVVAGGLCALLVPVSRAIARAVGVLDNPGGRKIHHEPTPRLGGIALVLSFVGVVVSGYLLIPELLAIPWLVAAFGNEIRLLAEAHRVEPQLVALLLGGVVVFGVGLLDDFLGSRFPVALKAGGQVAAALILIFGGGVTISFLPYEWMNVAVTLLWIVGMTNAFNLLDNMDGLSSGVALVASGILALNAWFLGEYFITLIFATFMGSLAGFLVFNFKPASVFLGDCGSLFIGYMMGSLTIFQSYVSASSSTLFPVLMPVLVLAVPIVDTATVMAIRMRERRPIYVGDSRHLSHRLVSMGYSQRAAVLFIYLVTASLGLGAFALVDATPAQSALILLQATGFVTLILILMFGTPIARSANVHEPLPRADHSAPAGADQPGPGNTDPRVYSGLGGSRRRAVVGVKS
jgi:UDP-GlcNAc:undecaprenyl-phosphate GlcNAc-1-phosphate transferase